MVPHIIQQEEAEAVGLQPAWMNEMSTGRQQMIRILPVRAEDYTLRLRHHGDMPGRCRGDTRAVRCYERAGFDRTGEFWREDPHLASLCDGDLDRSGVREHIRMTGAGLETRFYLMERRLNREDTAAVTVST